MFKSYSTKALVGFAIIGCGLVSSFSLSATAQTSAGNTANGKTNALMPTTQPAKKAQPAKKVRFHSSNWNVQCQPSNRTKKLVCVLFKEVKTQKSKKLILRVSVSAAPHRLIMKLPHGLDLSAGVILQINGAKPMVVPFKTSSRQGAYTNSAIPAALIDALKKASEKGGKIVVAIKAVRGQKIAIPLSLKGFSLGFEKLK